MGARFSALLQKHQRVAGACGRRSCLDGSYGNRDTGSSQRHSLHIKFDNPKVITGSFKRENLVWWVNQTGKKQREILRTVKRASRLGSGIIYCATRKDCEVWAEELSSLGVGCLPYHAGLQAEKRSEVQ